MRYLFGLALLFFCLTADAQLFTQGKIVDSESREPLPFVNVSVLNRSHGTTTGIDGTFKLSVSPSDSLYISYVGYEAIRIAVTSADLGSILMRSKSEELKEVEIFAGENPAFAIIRKAIENVRHNDPENLPAFSYKAYHKLFATAEGTFDTIENKRGAVKFFDQNYLFLNETYSERQFVQGRHDRELIVANRMSGVRDPFFAVLGNQFQSFSFYNSHIRFLDQQFINPLSPGTFNRYDFILEETRVNTGDTSFVISFAPLPGKTFAGVKGVMTINSNQFGIENIKAEPADDAALVTIRVQHKYMLVDGHWFPQELSSEFVLREQKVSEHPIKYVHRSYLSDAKINQVNDEPERSNLTLEFAKDSNKKDEAFWNSVRSDSLSKREQNTYDLYDSMPIRTLAILNAFVKVAEAAATGKIKVGRFYIPLESLFRRNGYEGVRPGLGFQTDEALSKYFVAEAYAAVGTKDRAIKFGGSLQVNLTARANIYFKFSYCQDVLEPGNANFLKPPPMYASSERFRNWLTTKMDSVQRIKAQFNFRPFRFAESSIFMQRTLHDPTYGYSFRHNSENAIGKFTLAEAGMQFKFVAGEQVSQIRNTKIVTGFKYPLIDFLVSKSLENILDGQFNYTKAEAKIDYQHQWRGSAKTAFQIAGGIIRGEAPYFALFNARGSNSGKLDLNRFVIPNYFQTMKIYEFASDRYIAVFFTQHFGRIVSTRSRYFRPELAINQNVGFSDLSNPGLHSIALQPMKKGFYESGVALTNLLRINYVNIGYLGLGGAVFYRYGSYAIPEESKNIVLKISVSFAL